MNYTPHRRKDIREMLKIIEVKNIDELFEDIPEDLKKTSFYLPHGLAQLQLLRLSHEIARKNKAPEYLSFLGAGAYEHHIPSVVKEIISLPGFLTPYTPYQAEASQGNLETIFDFQTLVCELTGMEATNDPIYDGAVNASMYDGPTALAEAVVMAMRISGKNKIIFLRTVNPLWLKVVETLIPSAQIQMVPFHNGTSDLELLETVCDDKTAAVVLQYPNFFGCLEEVGEIEKIAHRENALLVACANPIALGILKSPGEWNADIVVGDGQPLGIPLNFGGPYLGFFATRMKWLRQMPGRIVGRTTEKDDKTKTAYALILQTREQHIRRERASSNICTNSNLNAVAFAATLLSLGSEGLEKLAWLNFGAAQDLRRKICQIPGFNLRFTASFFNEFVIDSETAPRILNEKLLEKGIIGGLTLENFFPELKNASLWCATETKNEADIDKLFCALAEITNVTKKDFVTLQKENSLPKPLLPKKFLREKKPQIPKIPEEELLEMFIKRSEKNFAVDTHFYPLGSCTMKLSPKENEEAVKNWRFQKLHPLAPEEFCQGTLQILWETQRMLSEICGMSQFSLQPLAGAHGELTGLLMTKAYYKKRGENQRNVILIPDTSHGTNPASAARAGFEIVTVKSTAGGEIDLDDLAKKVNEKTAALMITLPNTLGLFEKRILEISEIIHQAGGLVYMDGANLNALLGIAKPGKMGADVIHLNLHKTFSAPHGGGGPGSGPIGVTEKLIGFLPVPIASKSSCDKYYLHYDLPDSIGKVSGFYGNIGVILKTYFYLRALGKESLKKVSQMAVLNANYLRVLLRDYYELPHRRICMHEFVLKLDPQTATNVAKRLLDYGFHAPTVSFPFLGALMIEPTETENKETLDEFAEAMIEIAKELKENPELVQAAPHNTPVKRVDQTAADRNPMIRG